MVAAAVLPHPPVLIPEVAAGAAVELDHLRAACAKALGVVKEIPHDRLVVVGCADGGVADGGAGEYAAGDFGTMAGYGVPLDVRWPGGIGAVLSDSAPARRLPLSLTVAAWVMQHSPVSGGVVSGGVVNGWGDAAAVAIRSDEPTEALVAWGDRLANSADRVVMVAMGDGSNALSTKAPGYLIPGAREWHDDAVAALGSADVDVVLALDASEAARFGAVGRAPWQVMAAAASAPTSEQEASAADGVDTAWLAELVAAEEPYGVGYIVATWVRR